MKTEILVTLLFAAVASTLFDATLADDDTGMCPHEYFKKHPKAFKEKQALKDKYGMPNYNKLPSCSADGTCEGGLKCCKTPCGLKCMKPLYENNAKETLDEMYKSIGQGAPQTPYEMTEEDKKYGMCPETFMLTHPEIKKEMRNSCKHQKSHPNAECTHEDCRKHKGKPHRQLRNFTEMADCSVDGDCPDNTRCCNTLCGKKCVKPVFTKEDFMNSMFEEAKPREKRYLDEGEGQCMGHGRGGKCQGSQGENGQCQGQGGGRGKKGKGKGGKRGKGKGKGCKGKGQGNGGENGWDHGNDQGFGGHPGGGFQ